MISTPELQQRVLAIVAAALDHPLDTVNLHSSLIDDLGAESIDFLDIVFRLETAFEIKIPNEEVWAGAFQRSESDPAVVAEHIATLRQRMPDFRWDRLPAELGRKELPRLITPQTIVDYLERRLRQDGEGAP
jgi:acyl carrier protein